MRATYCGCILEDASRPLQSVMKSVGLTLESRATGIVGLIFAMGRGLAIHSTIRELFAAGPVSARVAVVLALVLALAAFSISGSWFQALQVLFEARADGDEWWRLLFMGFVGDITGTPGLLVSGLKTVFAVLVAFAGVRLLPVGRRRLSFSLKGIELSVTHASNSFEIPDQR